MKSRPQLFLFITDSCLTHGIILGNLFSSMTEVTIPAGQ